MRQHDITEYIKAGLLKDKKCIVSGLGVFELVAARKGKHFDMIKNEWVDKTSRKYRVRFKSSPVVKEWLKTIK